jgi:hypothetical protein
MAVNLGSLEIDVVVAGPWLDAQFARNTVAVFKVITENTVCPLTSILLIDSPFCCSEQLAFRAHLGRNALKSNTKHVEIAGGCSAGSRAIADGINAFSQREIASVLVHLDHIACLIVNANHWVTISDSTR